MTGQAEGFWKVRHAVIGMAVVGMLVVMIRGCGGEEEHATQITSSEPEAPKQGMYVQVPESQLPPRYVEVPPGYAQPGYVQQQPAYVYQQPAYSYAEQAPVASSQPAYGYGAQVQPQPRYPVTDPDNRWATPAANYQPQKPAQWGQPQPPQVQQWGQPQQPVYSQLPGSASQYRPLEDNSQGRQQVQSVQTLAPAMAWSAAPYDRRAGSSFGNGNATGAWSGGYAGYGYNPAYAAPPYGAGGWPGGYMAGWPAGTLGYPGYGLPGRW